MEGRGGSFAHGGTGVEFVLGLLDGTDGFDVFGIGDGFGVGVIGVVVEGDEAFGEARVFECAWVEETADDLAFGVEEAFFDDLVGGGVVAVDHGAEDIFAAVVDDAVAEAAFGIGFEFADEGEDAVFGVGFFFDAGAGAVFDGFGAGAVAVVVDAAEGVDALVFGGCGARGRGESEHGQEEEQAVHGDGREGEGNHEAAGMRAREKVWRGGTPREAASE